MRPTLNTSSFPIIEVPLADREVLRTRPEPGRSPAGPIGEGRPGQPGPATGGRDGG